MRFHASPRTRPPFPQPVALVLASHIALATATGCTQSRTFTIYAKPADAQLIIDGVKRGPGPITQTFQFTGPNDMHHVRAVAPGYEARGEDLWPDTPHDTVVLQLRPVAKKVVFTVEPEPAVVRVNGRPVAPGPVARAEYTIDAGRPDAEYVITAEREGYEPATRTLRGGDPPGYYPLIMRRVGEGAVAAAPSDETMRQVEPDVPPAGPARQPPATARVDNPQPQPAPPPAPPSFKRDVVVQTDPPQVGATIYIDGEEWGRNGLDLPGHEFKRDAAGRPISEKVTAAAPGYEGGAVTMRFEDQRREYVIPMGRRKKEVRIVTDPAGAVVTLDGKPVPRDRSGAASATILFPPTDPQDQPTTYVAEIRATSDAWEPQELKIGWDGGRQEYRVKLAPARTAKATLLRPRLVWREGAGWAAQAKEVDTSAVRDTSEGPGRPAASRFAGVPAGTVPDAVAISPDGSQVLCTLLAAGADGALRSSLRLFNADGSPGPTLPGEGQAVDLTPSFSPDGSRIFFASDRDGGVNVWEMPSGAEGGAEAVPRKVAQSANATIWPTVDSKPQQRLFYEAIPKGAAGREAEGPEIHVVEMAASPRTNMTLARGSQPRPSPRADSVVFTVVDPATGNRDLYMVSDQGGVPLGGQPVNLTNTPDVDECDPTWSRNGARIAFSSNAGSDDAGLRNYDVYVMTMTGADRRQTRVTFNGSRDDTPAWDPAGRNIYFRSNRGGQWAIWKVAAP